MSPIVLGLVITNTVVIVLCLFVLVTSSTDISPFRYLKFVIYFLAVMLEFFVVCCNSSEVADSSNEMIVNAIKQCSWEKCNNQTRRDLCVMLRRVQRPNHLKFNGVLVLSRPLFLKVAKWAYSFVNFMRFKTVK
uniref:Uncharacterized protein n=1 Tax=Cacopsylla melanoneura TaxID=428564 RepID=A0A8D9BD78_9HEMI